jgi:dsDNA-specific endonuclease/ATPase MutS2
MNTAKKITQQEKEIIEKIRTLAPERVAEVEDFIDFLRQRTEDRELVRAAAKLSEDAFRKVWDNPEDAVYDQL